MNLYVRNLAWAITDAELRQAFAIYGEVASARVVYDRETGRSKGFGFVQMVNQADALAAIEALNGSELQGRMLRISEAYARG